MLSSSTSSSHTIAAGDDDKSSSRDLFLLMDGTGRSPESVLMGKRSRTNIQILRDELGGKLVDADLEDGWEIRELQDSRSHSNKRQGLLFYDRGLGSPQLDNDGQLVKWSLRPSSFFKDPRSVYRRFLENDYFERLTAFGILDNVAQAYEFLVRNYRSDHSDRVFLFGFSRGAYTHRLLIQLIRYFGLVRKESLEADPDLIEKAFLLYNGDVHPRDNAAVKAFRAEHCLPGECHHENLVYFMGLFDTVRGMVIEKVHEDTRINKVVRIARHALSLDEQRPTYRPEIWTRNPNLENPDHVQMWFPGVHSDVGGSYKENSLSNVSLNWMVEEAGLDRDHFRDKYPPDPLGMQHDSYQRRMHENWRLTWAMVSMYKTLDRLATVPADADNLQFHLSVSLRAGKTVSRQGIPYVYPDHVKRFQQIQALQRRLKEDSSFA